MHYIFWQFASKAKDTLSELLEKAALLKFEHFFHETMQVAEAEDFASFESVHWELVKAELGVIATKRLQRHLVRWCSDFTTWIV